MDEKAKGKRGGKRLGAGRKPGRPEERQRNRVMVSLTDAELAGLEDVAEGVPAGTYLRRLLIRHLNRHAGMGERS